MNMNATMPMPAATVSIWTPFNRKTPKSTPETRRVLLNGRWKKVDEQASAAYRWLKGGN